MLGALRERDRRFDIGDAQYMHLVSGDSKCSVGVLLKSRMFLEHGVGRTNS